MDLALAVRRLADALGPDAPPALVERALTAVLDAGGSSSDASTPETRLWVVAAAPAGTSLLMDVLAALTALSADVYDVVQHASPGRVLVTLEADALDADTVRNRLAEVARRHEASLSVLRPSVATALLGG